MKSLSSNQNKSQLYASYGRYDVYLVDELSVRDLSVEDEEFTNFAIHNDFPKLIPKNQIWIAEKSEKEIPFLVRNALTQYKLLTDGYSAKEAYDRGVKAEKAMREKVDSIKNKGNKSHAKPPEKLYKELYKTIEDLEVWIVDGEIVRDLYKTDYIEGGHGYVYPWIPKDEIWIDDALKREEIDYVLYHEFTELKLMRDEEYDYESAHEFAAQREYDLREVFSIDSKEE